MDIAIKLLIQVVLIALNAFFAASELALVSLNEAKLRRQAENGDAKAAKLLKIVEQPTGFLSTIQVGITLAGFLGSAFAAESFSGVLANWLYYGCDLQFFTVAVWDTIAVVFITIVLSYFSLILGELVPKRMAMRNPEGFARKVCGVIAGLTKALKPVVWFLSVSTNGVLRMLRINPNENTEVVSEEDIMGLVDAVEEQGEIDNDTKEMIENVFEFDNTAVSEMMVRRADMTVVYETQTPEEILATMLESGLSRFPVCGENTDDIKGILRAREYLFAVHENPECKLSDVIREAKFVPDTIPANILFKEMRENKIHMAIVVDEYGQTAGLITMEDLLESIVGNIYDETDTLEAPEIELIEENHWHVAGSMSVEDAAEEIGVVLRDEEDTFDTIGGFVIANLAYIPQDGETPEFHYKNLQVKVLTVKEKRIEKIEIFKTEIVEDGETATEAHEPEVEASSK